MEVCFSPYDSTEVLYAKVDDNIAEQLLELLDEGCLYEEVRISNGVNFFYILLCQLTFVHTRE